MWKLRKIIYVGLNDENIEGQSNRENSNVLQEEWKVITKDRNSNETDYNNISVVERNQV